MSEFDETENESGGDAQSAEITAALAESETSFVTGETSPGRSAGMLLLTFLLIGAGAVYFMRLKGGPSKASAATPEASNAKAVIGDFLSNGNKNIKAMQDLLRNTEKLVQQFINYPSMTQIKLEELRANPFRFSDERKTGDEDEILKGKKLAEAREAEKAKARLDVSKLALQSILLGGSNTCMINNQMLSQGQQVGGFAVEKISQSSVVVARVSVVKPGERDRFEVKMSEK